MKIAGLGTVPKVGVVGCKHTTCDLVIGLARHGLDVDHMVTIGPEKAALQKVAGYMDLRPFAQERGLPITVAEKYSLKSDADKETLLGLGLDLILVMGWQRLIPDWWLEAIPKGAFGMHGSSKQLPYGRGRSPMNWSLIQNKKQFFTHLFNYRPGVDDGPILGVQPFTITEHDDCHTLHFKNMLAMIKLCRELLPPYLRGEIEVRPQSAGAVTYYPKRTSEDGLIKWADGTADVFNLVRAVTRPFDGAFSFLDDDGEKRVTVWRAIPFDGHLLSDGVPGEILNVFYDGTVLVKTGDGALLVHEHDAPAPFTCNDVGRRFGAAGHEHKAWVDVPL